MKSGRLYVLSGPSGSGKGTICKRLISQTDAALSVSMTTRAPRPTETEGVSYFFVSDEAFEKVVGEGGLLEYAEVYGRRYGTPKAPVLAHLEAGRDVILEIDIQGAMQVKRNYPEGVFVFILPPSMAELERRIKSRGADSEEQVRLRLGQALREMDWIREYDYYIINDDLDTAVAEAMAVMRAEGRKVDAGAVALIEKYRKEAEKG
ncbi:MAG: guanylate kinase [Clostridiales Family XIII bacterium]|jgi:guanylate kinase|nr:guanylate kinase [Clostridiales Family XIII bacterium]